MNKTRLQIAKADIIRHFDEQPQKVYLLRNIARNLNEQRSFWRLAQSTSASAFVSFLLDSGKLTQITFPFPKPYKATARYVWGEVRLYEVVQTLKPEGYFTHYTAMMFHGLTEQVPKTIYLNEEQLNGSMSTGVLTQTGIDTAFGRKPRSTNYVAEVGEVRVCIVNGKNTGNLGVITEAVHDASGQSLGQLRYTNLERTLIDVVVRPNYAGGVHEVAKAFGLAQEHLSVNRLAALVQNLRYIYPYHQALGYYLERAGYSATQLDLLRRFPMEYDFYLAHDMGEMDYIKEWRLYVPKHF